MIQHYDEFKTKNLNKLISRTRKEFLIVVVVISGNYLAKKINIMKKIYSQN